MMKFALNQTIFYLRDNRVHSAPVMARHLVENSKPDGFSCTSEQDKLYKPFGEAGISYSTCHGIIEETEAFASRRELAESLIGEEN